MGTARDIALDILYHVEYHKTYINIALSSAMKELGTSADRRFVSELVYGVTERKITIDYWIGRFSKVRIGKMSQWVHMVIRMAVYQLVYLDKIPQSAVCDESVKLIKKKDGRYAGFVNGILRNMIRNRETLIVPEFSKSAFHSRERFLSVKYSCPEWLIEMLGQQFSQQEVVEYLEHLYRKTPLTVRVNTLKISIENLMEKLNLSGIPCIRGHYSKDALLIENPEGLFDTEAFKSGLFYAQDESSMLVADVLAPKENDTILDVCSAPGGKVTHFAQRIHDKGRIIACDIYGHKQKLIRENAARLGIKCITEQINDASCINDEWKEGFDHVTADVPCSGTGTISHKPEIKWERSREDIGKLAEMQKQILHTSAEYVKPGGILIYTTCSVLKEENDHIINDFLKKNGQFGLMSFEKDLPLALRGRGGEKGMMTLYPHMDRCDGFFIARLCKGKGGE